MNKFLDDDRKPPFGTDLIETALDLLNTVGNRSIVEFSFYDHGKRKFRRQAVNCIQIIKHLALRHFNAIFPAEIVQIDLMPFFKLVQCRQEHMNAHGLQLMLKLDKRIELSIKVGNDHVELFLFMNVGHPLKKQVDAGRGIGY